MPRNPNYIRPCLGYGSDNGPDSYSGDFRNPGFTAEPNPELILNLITKLQESERKTEVELCFVERNGIMVWVPRSELKQGEIVEIIRKSDK